MVRRRVGRRLKGGSIGHIGHFGGGVGARVGAGSFTSPFRASSTVGGTVAHGVPVTHGVPVPALVQGRLPHTASSLPSAFASHAYHQTFPTVRTLPAANSLGAAAAAHQYRFVGGGMHPYLIAPSYHHSVVRDVAFGFNVAHVLRMSHQHSHATPHHQALPGGSRGAGSGGARGGGGGGGGGGVSGGGGAHDASTGGASGGGPPSLGAGTYMYGARALVRGGLVHTRQRGHLLTRGLASDYDRVVLLEPLFFTPPTDSTCALLEPCEHKLHSDARWPLQLRVHSLAVFPPVGASDASGGPPVPLVGLRAAPPATADASCWAGVCSPVMALVFQSVAFWLMAALVAMGVLGFQNAVDDVPSSSSVSASAAATVAHHAAAARLLSRGATSSDEEDAHCGTRHYPHISGSGGSSSSGGGDSSSSGGGGAARGTPPVLADGELAYEGCRVQTQWTRDEGGDDGWYAGTILRLQGRRATVHYDDGEMWTGDLDEIYSLRGTDDEEEAVARPPAWLLSLAAHPSARHCGEPPVAVGVPMR